MIILFSTVEGMLALPGLQEDFSREITVNRIIDLKFPEPHAKLSVGVAGWGRHPWSISTSSERQSSQASQRGAQRARPNAVPGHDRRDAVPGPVVAGTATPSPCSLKCSPMGSCPTS
jgi:hypothetical protein